MFKVIKSNIHSAITPPRIANWYRVSPWHNRYTTNVHCQRTGSREHERLCRALSGVLGEDSDGEPCVHILLKILLLSSRIRSTQFVRLLPPRRYTNVPYEVTPSLTTWTAVTVDEVEKLMGTAPNKSCQLDPSVWNSLLVELHDPDISIGSCRRSLKTSLFSKY